LKLKEHIYALSPPASLSIGKPRLGHVSNYYPGQPITDEEVAAVQKAAETYDIDVLNTRSVLDHIVEGGAINIFS
jgi:dipeptidyl-peptidase-3